MQVVHAAVGTAERQLGEALLEQVFVHEMRDDSRPPEGFETDPLHRPTTAPFTSIDPRSDLFCAIDDGEAIGALVADRLDRVPPGDNDIGAYRLDRFFDRFEPSEVAVIRWLAVDKQHRGGPALMLMFGAALDVALEAGVEFILLDCSPYLVRFYERFGARRFAPPMAYPFTGILTVPMLVPLSDIEHHQAMGSALTAMLEGRQSHRADVHEFLIDAFGPYGRGPAAPGSDAASASPEATGIFTLLPPDAHGRITSASSVLRVRPGDAVIRRGDHGGRRLRVVLDGYLEVLAGRGDERPIAVATIGPGDLIGEISLLLGVPATADVVALTEAAVADLDLDGSHGIDDGERVAIWRAVATLLAERLRRTTVWVEAPPLR